MTCRCMGCQGEILLVEAHVWGGYPLCDDCEILFFCWLE